MKQPLTEMTLRELDEEIAAYQAGIALTLLGATSAVIIDCCLFLVTSKRTSACHENFLCRRNH